MFSKYKNRCENYQKIYHSKITLIKTKCIPSLAYANIQGDRIVITVYGGTQRNWNYLLEGRALVAVIPDYMSVLGTHLYQCASWHCCEMLHSTSGEVFFFFLKIPSSCPFHDGWFKSAPSHTEFRRFWPKLSWPLCLNLFIHLILAQVMLFVSWMKKSSKGNILPM